MQQRHILLLDPNDGNRRTLAFLLHLAGYRVTEVVDGDEALNRLTLGPKTSLADLLLICLGETSISLGELLAQANRCPLPVLIVSEEVGLLRPAAAPATAPWSCRRGTVVETLAHFWATRPAASLNPDPGCPSTGVVL